MPAVRELVDFTTRIAGRPHYLHAVFPRPLDAVEHEHAAALLMLLAIRVNGWAGGAATAGRPEAAHVGNRLLGEPFLPLELAARGGSPDGEQAAVLTDRAADLFVAALDRATLNDELPPFLSCGVGNELLALRHRPGGATRVLLTLPNRAPLPIGSLELRRGSCAVVVRSGARGARRPLVAAAVVESSARAADHWAGQIVQGGAAAIEAAVAAGISRAVMVTRDGRLLLYPSGSEPADIPFLAAR